MRTEALYKFYYSIRLSIFYLSKHKWLIIGLSCGLLVLWSAMFYLFGQASLRHQIRLIYADTIDWSRVDSDNRDVMAHIKMIATQAKVSEQTVKKLRETLASKEHDVAELKEQIYFYRAIVAPEEADKKLSILSVRLGYPGEDGNFPFELVLRKTDGPDTLAKGHVEISLLDGDSDSSRRLPMESFYRGDKRFSFRYFQQLRGKIAVPEGFSPVRVEAVILRAGQSEIKKNWYWGDLLTGTHAY